MSVQRNTTLDSASAEATPAQAPSNTKPVSDASPTLSTPPIFATMAKFGCDMLTVNIRTWRQVLDANRDTLRMQQNAVLDLLSREAQEADGKTSYH